MINAKVIKDSIANGIRITTLELEYPRFIHGEFMTHRLFSRNAASSRAIPIDKMCQHTKDNPATPVNWGSNKSGMQAGEELKGIKLFIAKSLWKTFSAVARVEAKLLSKVGLHKQLANRWLETSQMIKVVVTATEYDNFFYLRMHRDAQPEIQELADCVYASMQESYPQALGSNEWHLPYIDTEVCDNTGSIVYRSEGIIVTEEEAIKISASCCAQVSYRRLNESLSVAQKIYKQLVEMRPVHASPFEHQARPMDDICDSDYKYWEDGVTHFTSGGHKWSGNFRGWIQHRQLIEENTCWEYTYNED